ncbi:MAG: lamin tail domain-containing protein, partial [bacterium]|nr:lamin tail domain-containing protein [bacterium]
MINEFVSDPADGEVEFIELYNKTNQEINLSDWAIYEGSDAKTALSGTIGGSGAGKFFVIEKPKGNLNNGGDTIILKWQEVIIDQVSYGDWDDFNIDNNAPVAADPQSVARYFDGANTFNNKNDFSITSVVTKGGSNTILDYEEQSRATSSAGGSYDYSSDIIISEILPNPFGLDDEAEFIELFNQGDKEVNLEGWALSDSGTRKYLIKVNGGDDNGIAA